jgi:hypothetical protein
MQQINGVDDGSIVYIGICFISAFFGCSNLFKEYDFPYVGRMRFATFVNMLLSFGLIFAIADNFRNIYKKRSSKCFQEIYKT